MSTLITNRRPAKLAPEKLSKQLEIHTIKKIINKEFSKKKYRTAIGQEIIKLMIECSTSLFKASNIDDNEIEYKLLQDAFISLKAMSIQLDIANTMYQTPIENMEYWASLITDLEDGIELWMKDIKKQ